MFIYHNYTYTPWHQSPVETSLLVVWRHRVREAAALAGRKLQPARSAAAIKTTSKMTSKPTSHQMTTHNLLGRLNLMILIFGDQKKPVDQEKSSWVDLHPGLTHVAHQELRFGIQEMAISLQFPICPKKFNVHNMGLTHKQIRVVPAMSIHVRVLPGTFQLASPTFQGPGRIELQVVNHTRAILAGKVLDTGPFLKFLRKHRESILRTCTRRKKFGVPVPPRPRDCQTSRRWWRSDWVQWWCYPPQGSIDSQQIPNHSGSTIQNQTKSERTNKQTTQLQGLCDITTTNNKPKHFWVMKCFDTTICVPKIEAKKRTLPRRVCWSPWSRTRIRLRSRWRSPSDDKKRLHAPCLTWKDSCQMVKCQVMIPNYPNWNKKIAMLTKQNKNVWPVVFFNRHKTLVLSNKKSPPRPSFWDHPPSQWGHRDRRTRRWRHPTTDHNNQQPTNIGEWLGEWLRFDDFTNVFGAKFRNSMLKAMFSGSLQSVNF